MCLQWVLHCERGGGGRRARILERVLDGGRVSGGEREVEEGEWWNGGRVSKGPQKTTVHPITGTKLKRICEYSPTFEYTRCILFHLLRTGKHLVLLKWILKRTCAWPSTATCSTTSATTSRSNDTTSSSGITVTCIVSWLSTLVTLITHDMLYSLGTYNWK